MKGKISFMAKVFLLIALIGLPDQVFSQKENDSTYIIPNSFQFNNYKARSVRIPFLFIHNLIIIPLRINDSDTLNFILDTGVKNALITDINFIEKITLHNVEKVRIKGLGEGEGINAYRSKGNSIFLKGISGLNQTVNVLADMDFMLSQHLGLHVHGLIGYDLFRQFVIKIDYDNEVISFYGKRVFAPLKKRKRSLVILFDFQGHKPLANFKIKFKDEEWLNVRLMLDLGASDAAWLSTESHPAIHLPEKWIETYLGQGLSGDIWGKRGKIEAIAVDGHIFKNPVLSFPDPEMVRPLIEGQNRHGSIGAEILQRFDVVVDYPGRQFILNPNSNYRKPFQYNKSGIELIAPYPEIPFFYVSNVAPGSAAHKAGVMKDDQILEINGLNASKYNMGELLNIFFGKEGKKVRMVLLRNGEKIEVSFRLESMF